MSIVDPLTSQTVSSGTPVVRCPEGHINRADSWAFGDRCHYPGCGYTGPPISIGNSQPGNSGPTAIDITWSNEPAPTEVNPWGWAMGAVAVVVAFCLGVFILGALSNSGVSNPTPSRPVTTQTGIAAVVASPTATVRQPTATARPNNPAPTRTPRPTATPRPPSPTPTSRNVQTVTIGNSVRGVPIQAMQFGNGSYHIIFIGGLHSGFAPSTVSLANRAIDHFSSRLNEIPSGVTLHIIPNASPDSPNAPGEKSGRLNANGVDLNRNWGCDWRSNAVWRRESISGGPAPFSEPETQALRDYITQLNPVAVVFWEAQATNGMSSPGGCGDRSLVSEPLARSYGRAAGYTVAEFESYALHGDVTNWLDSLQIPAIAVLLPSYTGNDWSSNLRGIKAVLNDYAR